MSTVGKRRGKRRDTMALREAAHDREIPVVDEAPRERDAPQFHDEGETNSSSYQCSRIPFASGFGDGVNADDCRRSQCAWHFVCDEIR